MAPPANGARLFSPPVREASLGELSHGVNWFGGIFSAQGCGFNTFLIYFDSSAYVLVGFLVDGDGHRVALFYHGY